MHEEPPDSSIHTNIVDAQSQIFPRKRRILFVEEDAIGNRPRSAHVPYISDMVSTNVTLPFIHTQGIHQIPSLAIPSILGVVLRHQLKFCLLSLIVCSKLCLALSTDL